MNLKVFGEKTPQFIYEDNDCVIYEEVANPQSPVHFVLVPKMLVPKSANASIDDEVLLGRLLLTAKSFAVSKSLHKSGYHVVVDQDPRSLQLKALHVFGRALHHMLWPTGPGARL